MLRINVLTSPVRGAHYWESPPCQAEAESRRGQVQRCRLQGAKRRSIRWVCTSSRSLRQNVQVSTHMVSLPMGPRLNELGQIFLYLEVYCLHTGASVYRYSQSSIRPSQATVNMIVSWMIKISSWVILFMCTYKGLMYNLCCYFLPDPKLYFLGSLS